MYTFPSMGIIFWVFYLILYEYLCGPKLSLWLYYSGFTDYMYLYVAIYKRLEMHAYIYIWCGKFTLF